MLTCLSNFFSFCRQDCPLWILIFRPQRPSLRDGDSRIPCGARSNILSVACMLIAGGELRVGESRAAGLGAERSWERIVFPAGCLRGVWGRLRQGGSHAKFSPASLDTDRGDICWSLLSTHCWRYLGLEWVLTLIAAFSHQANTSILHSVL